MTAGSAAALAAAGGPNFMTCQPRGVDCPAGSCMFPDVEGLPDACIKRRTAAQCDAMADAHNMFQEMTR